MFVVNHHIFTHNNAKYVIDVEKMLSVSIDKEKADALSCLSLDSNYPLKDEVKAKLLELNLIFEEKIEKPEYKKEKNIPISDITLFVTQECNLDCVYCYGDGGNYGSSGYMTCDTALKAVDWLVEQSGNEKRLCISFFGGEPLLNFPLIKKVTKYVRKLEKETEKVFKLGVTTNLSLLDEDNLSFLKKNNIIPLISFDGPKEIQDRQRPFKNVDRSSYDVTISKIKKLISIIPDIACRPTLMEGTDPTVIRESLYEVGFSKIQMIHASPSLLCSDKDNKCHYIADTLDMLESDAELFLKNVNERNTAGLKKQKAIGLLNGMPYSFIQKQKKNFPCGAGRKCVGISCSGDVYLCHRFVGMNEYRLGNVYEAELKRDAYLERSLYIIDKCSDCFAKYVCAGGCYYDNLARTGSLHEPSENTCSLMKRVMELTAYIVANLNTENKEYLVKEKIFSKRLFTSEELKLKKHKLIAEIENLGLTEEEFKEVTGRSSLEEFKIDTFPHDTDMI